MPDKISQNETAEQFVERCKRNRRSKMHRRRRQAQEAAEFVASLPYQNGDETTPEQMKEQEPNF